MKDRAVVLHLGPQLGLEHLRRQHVQPGWQPGGGRQQREVVSAAPDRASSRRRTASRRCSTGRTRFAATAISSATSARRRSRPEAAGAARRPGEMDLDVDSVTCCSKRATPTPSLRAIPVPARGRARRLPYRVRALSRRAPATATSPHQTRSAQHRRGASTGTGSGPGRRSSRHQSHVHHVAVVRDRRAFVQGRHPAPVRAGRRTSATTSTATSIQRYRNGVPSRCRCSTRRSSSRTRERRSRPLRAGHLDDPAADV